MKGHRPLVVSVLLLLLVVGACSPSVPDLAGEWRGPNITLNISREGGLYKVVCRNPRGGMNGTYTGKFHDGAIRVGTLCGDITYSQQADKLYFCGDELSRMRK